MTLDSFIDKVDLCLMCLIVPLVALGARVFEGGALPLSPATVARAGHQLQAAGRAFTTQRRVCERGGQHCRV